MRVWLVLALLAPFPAVAQDPPPPDCSRPSSQAHMNECAAESYQRADDDLNAVYKQAAASANVTGGKAPALLLSAQRAWIAYRDVACAAEAALYDGGTMQPAVHMGCFDLLTQARAQDLRRVYLNQ